MIMRVARSIIVSVGTTLLSACVLVTLAVGFGVPAGIANVIAVCCGIGPSYIGYRRFVWRRSGRPSIRREVAPFWLMSLAGLLISTIAVDRVGAWSHAWPVAWRAIALPGANLAVFGALWVAQFLLCDRVIFRADAASPAKAKRGRRGHRHLVPGGASS